MKGIGRHLVTFSLLILVLAVSAFTGCASGGSKSTKVVVGMMVDQTGPSAGIMKELRMGIDDYLTELKDSGVESHVKLVYYDHRLEAARYPLGYEYLQGQGAKMMFHEMPDTATVMAEAHAEDQIPAFLFSLEGDYKPESSYPWAYALTPSYYYEGRTLGQYILDKWRADGNTRPLTVGHIQGTESNEVGRTALQELADANPNEFVLVKVSGSNSQTAWADETAKLRNCDAIINSLTGPAAATLMSELVERGYTGSILSTSQGIPGAWTLIRATVRNLKALDGVKFLQYQMLPTDNTEFMSHLKQVMSKYHGDQADSLLKSGGAYMTGYLVAEIMYQVVADAAKTMGWEKVDGVAIRDAFEQLNMEISGLQPITLAHSGGKHILMPKYRIAEYQAAADGFYPVTDYTMTSGL